MLSGDLLKAMGKRRKSPNETPLDMNMNPNGKSGQLGKPWLNQGALTMHAGFHPRNLFVALALVATVWSNVLGAEFSEGATVQRDRWSDKLQDRYAFDRYFAVGHRNRVAVRILDDEGAFATRVGSRINEANSMSVHGLDPA